ncbi:MAG: HAD family hydrolase [Gemmatimonadales bacterium]|nr:MAG: HAD family hydrolase [Gemmatimonadales bacterium]
MTLVPPPTVPAPRAILFDAGNTLVFADRVRMAQIYRSAGVGWEADRFVSAELAAREELARRVSEGHVGTEPHLWRDYFITIFSLSGVPEDAMDEVGHLLREEHARDHLWTHVEEGTGDALEVLARQGYRLGVISNADGRMEDVLIRTGLRELVEFVIDSEKVGIEKPDPRIFREGARRLDLPPEDCLYVGDLYPVDVVGAWGADMSAILLDPAGRLEFPVDRVAAVRDLPDYFQGR